MRALYPNTCPILLLSKIHEIITISTLQLFFRYVIASPCPSHLRVFLLSCFLVVLINLLWNDVNLLKTKRVAFLNALYSIRYCDWSVPKLRTIHYMLLWYKYTVRICNIEKKIHRKTWILFFFNVKILYFKKKKKKTGHNTKLLAHMNS